MRFLFTLVLAAFAITSFSQPIREAVAPGGDWDVAATWSPNGVPKDGDIVEIKAGAIVVVKGNVYHQDNPKPDLDIRIFGTLQFNPSGVLDLGSATLIQLYTKTSQIISSGGGGSEYIYIGGESKYYAKNDQTITGPAFSNIGTPASPNGFSMGVLPIKLKSFTAQAQSGRTVLKWSTALEQNVSHFEVEKSTDARHWTVVQRVTAQGQPSDYTAYDVAPADGDRFYRLKSIDTDGHTDYSHVVKVSWGKSQSAYLSPNPASGQVTVSLSTPSTGLVQVQLVAGSGQMVRQALFAKGTSFIRLNLQGITPGICTLVLRDGASVVEAAQLLIR